MAWNYALTGMYKVCRIRIKLVGIQQSAKSRHLERPAKYTTWLVVIVCWLLHNYGVPTMFKTTERPFTCPIVVSRVIITRQVFHGISGIGDEAAGIQVEHACSREDACPHRIASTCIVRRLDVELLQGN